MTMRPLRCRVGIHDWHSGYTPKGDQNQSCTRCGKDRTERIRSVPLTDGSADPRIPHADW